MESAASDLKNDTLKQVRRHEVAIAELGSLPTTRGVYQKTGNLFFRTTVDKAKSSEQGKLSEAKAKLERLNS